MWLLFLRLQSCKLDIKKESCAAVQRLKIVSLLPKFILQVQALIWLKTGTWPYFHLCYSWSLPRCSCTSLLQAAARISDMEVHCQKDMPWISISSLFWTIWSFKKDFKQRTKTGRTANCSHGIKHSVIYHTSKSTILYWYKVLFTVIANSPNYSDSTAGVRFTLKLIVRE